MTTLKRPLPQTDPNTHPTDPDALAYLVFIFAPIGVIALALNWRKLGKPEWTLNTILAYVLLFAVIVLLAIIGVRTGDFNSPLVLGGVIVLAITHYSFAASLRTLQKSGYRNWVKNGTHEGFTYPFARDIGLSVLFTAVLFGGVMGLVLFQSRPVEVTMPGLTYTRTAQWTEISLQGEEFCADPAEYECMFALGTARFGSTQILVGRFPAGDANDAAEHEAQTRRFFEQASPEITVTGSAQVTIGGVPAAQRTYSGPGRYGEMTFVIKAGMIYEIIVESTSQGIFDEDRQFISDILDSIQFS